MNNMKIEKGNNILLKCILAGETESELQASCQSNATEQLNSLRNKLSQVTLLTKSKKICQKSNKM